MFDEVNILCTIFKVEVSKTRICYAWGLRTPSQPITNLPPGLHSTQIICIIVVLKVLNIKKTVGAKVAISLKQLDECSSACN